MPTIKIITPIKVHSKEKNFPSRPLYIGPNIVVRSVNCAEGEDDRLKDHDINLRLQDRLLVFRYEYEEDENGPGPINYITESRKVTPFLRLYVDDHIVMERPFQSNEIENSETVFASSARNESQFKDFDRLWGLYEAQYKEYQLPFHLYDRALAFDIVLMESLLFMGISAEGVLLQRVKDELAYRFSLRAGHLLGTTSAEIKEWHDFFANVYKYRSAVAHANHKELVKINGRIGSASAFHKKLKEALASILRILIEEPGRVANIDDKILS